MPVHCYLCPSCAIEVESFRPVTERASTNPPICTCGITMEWLPKLGGLDAYDVRGFDTQVLQRDGSHATVHVGSLSDIRRIERDTEQRHRDGEGQPMRWRDYSQNRSNREVNSFGPSPAERAKAEFSRTTTRGEKITTRRGDGVRRDHE